MLVCRHCGACSSSLLVATCSTVSSSDLLSTIDGPYCRKLIWPLLWFAWCWFSALTWSADAQCGQLLFGCQTILVLFVVPMMLAAFVLVDSGDVWLWFPTSVPLRCLMALAILIHPLAEVHPRFLLPSWLCLCGSFHPLPLPCSRVWHDATHRPPWPCFVVLSALASHCGLPRGWWVLLGLCAAHDPWIIVWMGSWCMIMRYEPARFIVSWWLPHPGVWCQGPLRWLVRAARDRWVLSLFAPWWLAQAARSYGSSGPPWWLALAVRTYGSPGPVSWHASIFLCAVLCTWWILRCFLRKPSRFSLMDVFSRTRAHHGVLLRPP
ncbi:hypothetical protein GQ457_05G022030 [Hibiscus cannabinus]